MKKGVNLLAMFMSAILLLPVFSGCAGKEEKATTAATSTAASAAGAANETSVKKEPALISLLLQDNPSWPFNKEAEIFKVTSEKANVKLDLTIIPEANYSEKKSIIMASGEMPDVMFIQGNQQEILKYAQQGMLLPIGDMIDNSAPNIKRFFPAEQKIKIQSSNKEIYSLPRVYNGNIYYFGWLARGDIMNELGIAPPETLDEFYNMLKAMKAKYPNSYPLLLRQKADFAFLNSWGVQDSWYMRNGKYELGGTRQEDKELVTFVNKLFREKLIDPEFPVTSTEQWQEKITNNKGFVTFDYMVRCEYFQDAVKSTNPNFNLQVLPIPKAGDAQPNIWVPDTLYSDGSFVISNKTKVAEDAIRLFDFLYSDEGIELCNWGVEGKTFKSDGNGKTFLPEVKTSANPNGTIDIMKDYNIQLSFLPVSDTEAFIQMNLGPSSSKGFKMYTERNYARPITPTVDAYMTKEESDKFNELKAIFDKQISENILKFMLGKRPVSEWDKFQDELKKQGVTEYIQLYQNAYDKMMGK